MHLLSLLLLLPAACAVPGTLPGQRWPQQPQQHHSTAPACGAYTIIPVTQTAFKRSIHADVIASQRTSPVHVTLAQHTCCTELQAWLQRTLEQLPCTPQQRRGAPTPDTLQPHSQVQTGCHLLLKACCCSCPRLQCCQALSFQACAPGAQLQPPLSLCFSQCCSPVCCSCCTCCC